MMKSTVKERVEEVVDDEQQWRREDRVAQRHLARIPDNVLLRRPHVSQRVVEKHRYIQLVEPALGIQRRGCPRRQRR